MENQKDNNNNVIKETIIDGSEKEIVNDKIIISQSINLIDNHEDILTETLIKFNDTRHILIELFANGNLENKDVYEKLILHEKNKAIKYLIDNYSKEKESFYRALFDL